MFQFIGTKVGLLIGQKLIGFLIEKGLKKLFDKKAKKSKVADSGIRKVTVTITFK